MNYLLKPVNPDRLGEAIVRAHERLERADLRHTTQTRVQAAVTDYESNATPPFIERIPVRRGSVVTVPATAQIVSLVAQRKLLHITTAKWEQQPITYRLKDLERRLDATTFARLGRGVLAAMDMIVTLQVLPGGGHLVSMANGRELHVSRSQSRLLRDWLLTL